MLVKLIVCFPYGLRRLYGVLVELGELIILDGKLYSSHAVHQIRYGFKVKSDEILYVQVHGLVDALNGSLDAAGPEYVRYLHIPAGVGIPEICVSVYRRNLDGSRVLLDADYHQGVAAAGLYGVHIHIPGIDPCKEYVDVSVNVYAGQLLLVYLDSFYLIELGHGVNRHDRSDYYQKQQYGYQNLVPRLKLSLFHGIRAPCRASSAVFSHLSYPLYPEKGFI